jgi:hypothetical protein
VIANSDLAAAYRASGQTIHEFVNTSTRPIPAGRGAMFRFTVLREPLKRLLSAYLNKFVVDADRGNNPVLSIEITRTIRRAQRLAGIGIDLERSISFEEFVRYVGSAHDLDLELHWLPQMLFTGPDLSVFDHVGAFERLDETFALLAERFGYVNETGVDRHIRFPETHVTKYDPRLVVTDPFRMLPRTLKAFAKGFPQPEEFYTPELADIVRARYAADVDMHGRL